MSCGHDGCTCGPATDTPATPDTALPVADHGTEVRSGCCGGHDHEEQPA